MRPTHQSKAGPDWRNYHFPGPPWEGWTNFQVASGPFPHLDVLVGSADEGTTTIVCRPKAQRTSMFSRLTWGAGGGIAVPPALKKS